MMRKTLFGWPGLALLAATAGIAQPPSAPPSGTPMPVWQPDAIPSVLNPVQDKGLTAWEPYKVSKTKPSVDQQREDPILKGAIDIHAHFGPDVYNRQWDAFEIARRAKVRGMRGIVIKSHWTESAALAQLLRKYVTPDLEVWGGLALNASVGGINPMAVRVFAEMEGGYGKVVWLPTHDSEHEVTFLKQNRPYVRVSQDGKLLPQLLSVLDLIARYKLTLATGHIRPDEMLQVMAEAKKRGIDRIIITHPGLGPMFTDPSIDQLKQAVALGGYAEVVASELFGAGRAATIATIRAIGPEHCILSSDSGLVGTPNHTDALAMAADILRKEGFSETQLDLMAKRNPARVLGLPTS